MLLPYLEDSRQAAQLAHSDEVGAMNRRYTPADCRGPQRILHCAIAQPARGNHTGHY